MDTNIVNKLMEKAWDGEGLRLEYWLQWQVTVCALIITVPSVILVRLLIAAKLKLEFKSSDMWLPCWENISPFCLLYFRAFAFVFMACQLHQVFVHLGGVFVIYFYTQWTFALVIMYFALTTTISIRGCWMYFKKSLIETRADSLDKLTQAIYQTCAGAVVLTDITFWCLLLPFVLGDTMKLTPLVISLHSVNAVFLIIDSALNSQPFSWYGVVYFLLWSVSFVIFHWALHARGFAWWAFPFLDLSTPWAPLWYIAMGLTHIPCYGVYVIIIKIKGRCLSGCSPPGYTIIRNERREWHRRHDVSSEAYGAKSGNL